MPGTDTHMICIPDSKVDVSDIHPSFGENPKMIVRCETAFRLSRHHTIKAQPHFAKRKIGGRNRQTL